MSVLTCAEVRELAPELALEILGGAERAEVVLHVNGCARCQAYVSELTEAADAIPQLVPEHEPPAGFEERVIHRLDEGRRRSRRRWVASIAAAAAVAAIFSITIVRVGGVRRHEQRGVRPDRDQHQPRTPEAGCRGDGGWGPRDTRGLGVRRQPSRRRGVGQLWRHVGQLPHPGRAAEGYRDDDRHHDHREHPRLVDRSEPGGAGGGLAHRARRRRRARGVSRDRPCS